MKRVAKYNLYKGISTLLTFATPTVTLACCGEFFKHRSDTSLSAAGVFVLILILFFAKDKIVEKLKMPAPFLFCALVLIFIIMIENILVPIKTVCIMTLVATGVDELTFKRFYKTVEKSFKCDISDYKKFGFIFSTTSSIEGG